ncbi:MAG: ribosome maturation factor RimP [Acidimicrobiales bacterium]
MSAEEEIAQALRPAVSAAGLEIWDVERSGASVRVLVDRAGGVDLDAISDVTGAVSAVLDQRNDLVPSGRYMLEVSSPGLERRLRYPRHFARYVGEEVTVKTTEAVHGARRLRGTLLGATDFDITLRVCTSSQGTEDLHLALGTIERANAVFTWGPAPKPPKPARPTKPARSTKPARAAKTAPAGAGRRPAGGSADRAGASEGGR